MAELDTVVGQHGVDLVRHERDQRAEEVRCCVAVGFCFQLGESQLRGSVDGHKQVELALF